MLQLYPRNAIDFSWNGDPIRHSYDEHVIRDEGWMLTFKVLIDEDQEYKNIKRGMVIKAWTLDGDQAFRVWDIIEGEDYVEVEALHLLYDLDTKLTNPIHVTNGGLNSALAQFKAGLPSEMGPFEFSTGITKQRTYNTADADEEDSKYNALDVFIDGAHSIVGTWEAELLVNNWDIRLVESLGSRTSALLYEKKNISEFENEESNKNLITRIHVESTYRPERDEDDTEEPEEVTITTIVESPLINEYEQVYERHYRNNDLRTTTELQQWAMRKFTYEHVDKPTRTIKVATNIIDDTEINYGDYLTLKYLTHDIDEEIRCVGYDVNPVTKDVIEVVLGGRVTSISGQVSGVVQDLTESQLSNLSKSISERVTKVIMASNNRNRMAFGPDPVPNPIINDLWYEFQFDTPNEVTIKRWDGERWVILMDDFMGERIKEQIATLKEEYDETKQSLDDNILRTDNLFDEWEEMKENFNYDELENSFINIVGTDGKWVYSKNRLHVEKQQTSDVSSNEVILTLEEHELTLTHNGEGYSVGNEYTFSYSNPTFVERPFSIATIRFEPTPLHEVHIDLVSQHPQYPNYERTVTSANTNFAKAYHDDYSVTATSSWYESVNRAVTVDKNTVIPIPLEYKTGQLTINHNDAEIFIDGESIKQSGSVTFNVTLNDYIPPIKPVGSVTFGLPGGSLPDTDVESKFGNARVVNLADYGGVGDGATDNFDAFDRVIKASVNEPLVLQIDDGNYFVQGEPNRRLEPWPNKSKGLRLEGTGNNVNIYHKNNRTVNRHEYYFMQLVMTPDSLGFEAENFTLDGIRNPQEELFYTQSESNPITNIPMARGISVDDAYHVIFNNVRFKNMYGGYAIQLQEYRNVSITNTTYDKVGGNDQQESFGMAIYLGGHSGNAIVNIDNAQAQGMVTDKDLRLSWIGVVLENGTIQSNNSSAWLRDVNTTVNITNSSFLDYHSTFHVESIAGNVYWNVDNVDARGSNYQIVAGVYGEYKESTNDLRFDMLPYGRLWGIVKGLYYSEAQEAEDNWNGHNTMNMYNSIINFIKVAGFDDPPQAIAYGSNVTGRLHNTQLNNVPHKLVTNGSALLYDSEVNLAQGSQETRQTLMNGNFSDTNKQRVQFNNTNVNAYGSHRQVQFGNKPAFVQNEGFVPPFIDLPIQPPI